MHKDWKIKFKELEEAKDWDFVLELLIKVIEENPDEKDAYIFMHYFFMNLFLEADDYDINKHDYYESINIKYFKFAYEKYRNDAEYLFWTSFSICQCPWHFGIYRNDDECKRMSEKACLLNPKNILYKSYFFSHVKSSLRSLEDQLLQKLESSYDEYNFNVLIRKEKLELFIYIKEMSDENSEIRKEVASKGSLGKFFLKTEMFTLGESLQYKEL